MRIKKVQRFKGFVGNSMVLKRNAGTTMTTMITMTAMTGGVLVLLDPSSIIPMTPTFSYNHKFENSKWDFDFILPQRILFRRQLSENGRLGMGTELNSENFYINLDNPEMRGVYELNQLELKSGITYEYHFAPRLIGMFKAGINNVVNVRLTQRGERTSN